MRLWIAAACVFVGALVGGWLVRRHRQAKNVTPGWLNETAYDKRGDRRFK